HPPVEDVTGHGQVREPRFERSLICDPLAAQCSPLITSHESVELAKHRRPPLLRSSCRGMRIVPPDCHHCTTADDVIGLHGAEHVSYSDAVPLDVNSDKWIVTICCNQPSLRSSQPGFHPWPTPEIRSRPASSRRSARI